MTDRELIEQAGKAAAIPRSPGGDLWSNARGLPWNPLADYGDALQLAAARYMTVAIKPHEVEVFDYETGECLVSLPVWHKSVMAPGVESDQPVVVACRAITMAAAKLHEMDVRDPREETMVERPILFSAPMVRAILAGTGVRHG